MGDGRRETEKREPSCVDPYEGVDIDKAEDEARDRVEVENLDAVGGSDERMVVGTAPKRDDGDEKQSDGDNAADNHSLDETKADDKVDPNTVERGRAILGGPME